MRGGGPIRLARMLRPARTSLALVLCLGAGVLGACGSGDDGTIPPGDSETMQAQLNSIEAAVNNGNCEIAQNGVTQLDETVFDLPKEVGAQTKDDLRKLVDNLSELASDPSQCDEATTTTTTTTDTGTSGAQGEQ